MSELSVAKGRQTPEMCDRREDDMWENCVYKDEYRMIHTIVSQI